MPLGLIVGSAIVVILLGGLVGGWINYLQASKTTEPTSKHSSYYFILSVAAAFCVPLFLSLTKSELLKNVLSEAPPHKIEDWFILFAVCLIAAIYAQTFLESVSKNLLQRVTNVEVATKEATEKAEEAVSDASAAVETTEKAVEKLESAPVSPSSAEPQGIGEASESDSARIVDVKIPKVDINQYDEPVKRVVAALRESRLSLRSISGIAQDAGLSRREVRSALSRLIADGVVLETLGPKTGNLLYMLRLEALKSD